MRKFILLFSFFVFVSLIFFIACEKKDFFQRLTGDKSENLSTTSTIPCGSVKFFDILSEQNIQVGVLNVFNDQQNIHLDFNLFSGYELVSSQVFVGKCKEVPTDDNLDPDYFLFPYSVIHNPASSSHSFIIPLTSITDCNCIVLHTELKSNSNPFPSGSNVSNAWAYTDYSGTTDDRILTYCGQACRFCSTNIGDFRTQTQGGWGAPPKGKNVASYLFANFSSAFPNGIKVGCANGYSILLTSAQAVSDFLPQGGLPTYLSQNYTDPNFQLSVLAGQVVALTLSVGFDSYDANFGNSTTLLGNLVITTGTFQGWTVSQLLNEANNILGACPSVYTASQINFALDAINNNFTDGTQSGSFLTCLQ